MSDQPMTELEALRVYFDAHMDMHHATTEEAFARLYVKANVARDRLLEIAGGEPEDAVSAPDQQEHPR